MDVNDDAVVVVVADVDDGASVDEGNEDEEGKEAADVVSVLVCVSDITRGVSETDVVASLELDSGILIFVVEEMMIDYVNYNQWMT